MTYIDLNIYIEEQLLRNCFLIKDLILLNIQITMDMNVDLLQWFKMFLIKKRQVVPLRKNLWNMKNWLKNFTNQLIEKLRNEIGSSFIDNI